MCIDPTLYRISVRTMSQAAVGEDIPRGEDGSDTGDIENDSFHPESNKTSNDRDPRRCKHKQTSSLSRVTRKRNEITNLMMDEENVHIVKSELVVFNEHCRLYLSAHTDLCDVLLSDNDLDTEIKRYEKRQISIIQFRDQVNNWIRKAERHLTDNCDSASRLSKHSHKSRSSRLSKSSQSGVSAKAKEKARIAELMIEKDMLRKRQNLQIQKDKLKLDMEIAKAKAREEIYSADDQDVSMAPKQVHCPIEPGIEVVTPNEVLVGGTGTKAPPIVTSNSSRHLSNMKRVPRHNTQMLRPLYLIVLLPITTSPHDDKYAPCRSVITAA